MIKRIIVEMDEAKDVVITPRAQVDGGLEVPSEMNVSVERPIEDILRGTSYGVSPSSALRLWLECKHVDILTRVRPPSMDELLAAWNEKQKRSRNESDKVI
jgi:hypothetical protein